MNEHKSCVRPLLRQVPRAGLGCGSVVSAAVPQPVTCDTVPGGRVSACDAAHLVAPFADADANLAMSNLMADGADLGLALAN